MMPRHSVAVHCQWSTGAYASLMGMRDAKWSDVVREKPRDSRAMGMRDFVGVKDVD